MKVQSTAIALVPALKHYLSAENTIDMVLLGPNVTDNGNMCEKDLQKLVKTASRPIVILGRHAPPIYQT
ncbi:MAG TPA: hypothetical protein VLD55_05735 [Candidatus Sulfobium mesophilum]|nr:hypothetical protein [Candidatus Sulfobium mesophilum]